MTEERRAYPRQELPGVVAYHGSAGVSCLAIRNISQGGIRLVLSAAEQPGERVHMRVALLPDVPPLELSGQVVWARQAAPYEAGIRFIEVSLAQHEILSANL